MKIENINIGCDPSRVQMNKPSFYVNWIENSEQKYRFFQLRFAAENFKNRLLGMQSEKVKILI